MMRKQLLPPDSPQDREAVGFILRTCFWPQDHRGSNITSWQVEGEVWGSQQEPAGPVAGNLKDWRRESSDPAWLPVCLHFPLLAFLGMAPPLPSSFRQPFPCSWVSREGGNALCCKTSHGPCLLSWGFSAVLQRNVELSLSSKAKSIIKVRVDRSQ